MDEPTAALGVAQTAMVLDLVRRLADRGLAVLIISHNMNDVFEVADRIAVLYLGRMVAVGPTARARPPDRRRPDDDGRVHAGRAAATGSRSTDDGAARRAPRPPTDRARGASTDAAAAGRRPPPAELVADSLGEYLRTRSSGSGLARAGSCRSSPACSSISILFQSLNSQLPDRGQPGQPARAGGGRSCCWPWARCSPCCSARSTCRSASSPALGAVIMAELGRSRLRLALVGRRSSPRWPRRAAIGALQGTIITRLGLPSFVVTLAGLLVLAGRHAADPRQRRLDPDSATRPSTTSRAATCPGSPAGS